MVDITEVVYDCKDDTILKKVNTNNTKKVVLTIDDGPSRVLPQLLDVLRDEEVPAVFFWQSKLLFHEREWQRVLDEGHLIGTHSTKHRNMVKLSFEEQFQDVYHSVEKIEEITGQKVRYFRPPYGQYNENTLEVARELQLVPVMWRISSMDWELKHDSQKIISNVCDHLEDGAIILLHELRQTLEVLPELIKAIKQKGYGFTLL
ncbi:polysaccharide deacetylase family protein [Litchfieldia alkalitelluris]|uniref:polysaccharide deacetylase family protein n=1 Tax=Litchfieldia alkalitelluris TaxID=304268 RepID=UPI001116E228|nr:polysaccharide deacetylase family protein [Litchfieldia alkalitelluris]